MSEAHHKVRCLIDSAAGVYIPKEFVEDFHLDKFGIEEDSWAVEICKEGPEHEDYWDAWQDILDSAKYQDDDGYIWRLHQDGDLFLYRDDMTEEEWEYHFGL